MENLDRLFRDAKRLKPDEALWKRIAGGVAGAAKTENAGVPKPSRPAAPVFRTAAPEASSHWGWRMAAGFALAVGALAALLVTHPGQGRSPDQASQGGPKPGQVEVGARGGAEDFSGGPVATGPRGAGTVQAVSAEESALDDVLDWHADLGEAEGWEEDDALLNPLLAE